MTESDSVTERRIHIDGDTFRVGSNSGIIGRQSSWQGVRPFVEKLRIDAIAISGAMFPGQVVPESRYQSDLGHEDHHKASGRRGHNCAGHDERGVTSIQHKKGRHPAQPEQQSRPAEDEQQFCLTNVLLIFPHGGAIECAQQGQKDDEGQVQDEVLSLEVARVLDDPVLRVRDLQEKGLFEDPPLHTDGDLNQHDEEDGQALVESRQLTAKSDPPIVLQGHELDQHARKGQAVRHSGQ